LVPAIRGSCGKTYGAAVPGTVILTKPDWDLAVISWPTLPGMEHLVAVASHSGLVENHATGFSLRGTWAVLGLMCPEMMICLSFTPVVKWKTLSGGSGPGWSSLVPEMGIRWTWICTRASIWVQTEIAVEGRGKAAGEISGYRRSASDAC